MSGDTVEVAGLLDEHSITLQEQDRYLTQLSEAIDAAREGLATRIEVNGQPIAALVPWPGELTDEEHETLEGQMAITRASAAEIGGILDRIEAGLDAERLAVKLALVIEILCEKDVLTRESLGIKGFAQADVEAWLRS